MPALVIDLATESVASDSLRDRLAQAISDAAGHRYPDISGCCHPDLMCRWHEADMAMHWGLRLIGRDVERADSDKDALALIHLAGKPVRDEIAGATKDEGLIAAIRGGEGGNGK